MPEKPTYELRRGTRTAIWYGESGLGKTANLAELAKYIYATTGKTSRLISCEQWDTIQKWVDAGIFDVLDIRAYPDPLPLMRKVYQGCWPNKEAEAKLRAGAGGKLGPGWCARIMTPSDWTNIGLCAFEGFDTWSGLLFNDYLAKGRVFGGDNARGFVGKYEEEGMIFGMMGQSHYGNAQNAILELLNQLPRVRTDWVIFTTHEAKGEDNIERTTIIGPGTAGKALIGKVAPLVGDMLHFDFDGNGNRVAFFEYHAAGFGQKLRWPAKVRVDPGDMSKLRERWNDGFFPLIIEGGEFASSVHTFYAEVERLSKSSEDTTAWKAKIDAELAQRRLGGAVTGLGQVTSEKSQEGAKAVQDGASEVKAKGPIVGVRADGGLDVITPPIHKK